LPFDQSCPDITAHALRALQRRGAGASRARQALARGAAYLARTQGPDGAWLPLWFGNQLAPRRENPVLGTARVVLALSESGDTGPMLEGGVGYLLSARNPDGGWGGAQGVVSTVEETALAVSALAATGAVNDALAAGVRYLMERVESGEWTTPAPIGLYFSSLWYSEELYPVIWCLEALARARRTITSRDQTARATS
jgi:squalene-hopene/tetraprenyl-beta-curcumene cyclase